MKSRPRRRRDPFAGVYYDKRQRKFQAKYREAGGKQVTLGYFYTQEDAAHAYNAAIDEHGLRSIRKINKVDSTGKLVPKPKKRSRPRR